MQKNKVLGWIFIVIGAWYLLSGVVTNDMSGLASLGYNPDAPMSFQLAPFRFVLGIAINALIIYCGIRMVRQARAAN
ncbi:hypothetical protein ASD44_03740 [Mesorhizobium sp. Root554]|uniref:hypothetical protein n=1 Tax=unclassified Mesorhizobium TaxID=325217 RepID=UPI0006F8D468|nr:MULTISPECIES: hypothetical protein [unclassified Mesorhizobium]KQZ13278.1 hypothetical protein ASD27_03745 [Mesorhizobium sp. Root1471]KQZ35793.1 hypothetical protein ASD44_03740 [Mesorhizobium sp. Root554]